MDATAGRGDQTRKRIIDAAYRTFYRVGFLRSGLDAIADAAHVTKRTLYYHFDSKHSLLAAVLANQNDLAFARIRRWAEKAGGEPLEIVAILFAELEAWAKHPVGPGQVSPAWPWSWPTCLDIRRASRPAAIRLR
jgi:AcrR family transcriptional regulator